MHVVIHFFVGDKESYSMALLLSGRYLPFLCYEVFYADKPIKNLQSTTN